MTSAAVLLAIALLLNPRRSRLPHPPAGRRRLPTPAALLWALPGLVGLAVLAPPALTVACLAAAVVARIRRRRQRRAARRRATTHAMAGALEIVVGELQIGAHPVRAFEVAAAESSGEVGAGLRAVSARARLGADAAGGLRALREGSAVPDSWERLAVLWRLAADHGLAMSALMNAAHRDIVDRQRFADRMHAALAGARATAVLLAALPGLGILLGQLIGAHPVRFLLGGGSGGWLLMVGTGLVCAGMLWADRIVDRAAI